MRVTFSPLQADYLVALLADRRDIANEMIGERAGNEALALFDRVDVACDHMSSDLRTNRTLSDSVDHWGDVVAGALKTTGAASALDVYGARVKAGALAKLRQLGMKV